MKKKEEGIGFFERYLTQRFLIFIFANFVLSCQSSSHTYPLRHRQPH